LISKISQQLLLRKKLIFPDESLISAIEFFFRYFVEEKD